MDIPLPETSESFEQLSWAEVKPWYDRLTATKLSQENVQLWLARRSRLSELVDETLLREVCHEVKERVQQETRTELSQIPRQTYHAGRNGDDHSSIH